MKLNIYLIFNREIQIEFPSTDKKEFLQFMQKRGYDKLVSKDW